LTTERVGTEGEKGIDSGGMKLEGGGWGACGVRGLRRKGGGGVFDDRDPEMEPKEEKPQADNGGVRFTFPSGLHMEGTGGLRGFMASIEDKKRPA